MHLIIQQNPANSNPYNSNNPANSNRVSVPLDLNYSRTPLTRTPITRNPANSNRFSFPFRVRVSGVLLYSLAENLLINLGNHFGTSKSYLNMCVQIQEISLRILAQMSVGTDWQRHRIVQVKILALNLLIPSINICILLTILTYFVFYILGEFA